MSAPLHVAIVGGSISGCTLANGLLRQDHITFDVFESKGSFSERGAAIAMHTNALAALRSMGLDVDRILRDAGASKREALRTIVGCGEHKGTEFLETIAGPWGVGRVQLLDELVKPLPKERLHCNKKLVSITESDTSTKRPLVLNFADGSAYTADAVVGCDGFRSKVREIILGHDHPSVPAVFAGFWDARGLLPTEKAIEQFGTDLIDPRENKLFAVVGNGCFTLSGPIADGKMYFVTVAGVPPPGWDTSKFKNAMDREHLERTYIGWDERFKKGVIDCVLSSGPGVMFNQWESAPSPTYFRGNICMMGDAAHATSNWLGQGAAMAMEDCSVLVKLFEGVRRQEDFAVAFKAFDQVRRNGRADMVISQSRLLGQILTGQKGLDPEAVKHFDMQAERTQILSYDVSKQVSEAQEYFQKLKGQKTFSADNMDKHEFLAVSRLRDCHVFEDWYNPENGPTQLQLPFIQTGDCYAVMSSPEPQTIVIHELSDLHQLGNQISTRLQEKPSQRERAAMKTLQSQDCKFYRSISQQGDDDKPASITLAVTVRVASQDADELNTWYREEHLGLMSQVPGWIRTRRFELLTTGNASRASEHAQVEYLALYDFQAENGLQGPEHKAASATTRTAEIRGILKGKENMTLARRFSMELVP